MSIKYYEDSHVTIYQGDCRNMTELPDESVQMVVTSPPYWGLRRYSGEQELVWGGEKSCQHQWVSEKQYHGNPVYSGKTRWQHDKGDSPAETPRIYEGEGKTSERYLSQTFCALCGAVKCQLGLEPTVEMYVEHLVEICREIRRVLRKDGVFFLNCGDSYYGQRGGGWKGDEHGQQLKGFKKQGFAIKPKDLCLVPFRLAIALQNDGWWVRSVIIYAKGNPMPESVKDRPTESHEYILMLTKSARYYWDQEAVREPYTEPLNRWGGPEVRTPSHKYIESGEHNGRQGYGAASLFRYGRPIRPIEAGRNLRSVWTINTQPFSGAHFAVFPEKLVETCVKAATPEVGCCSKCGAPYERVTKPSRRYAEILEKSRQGGDWYPRVSHNGYGAQRYSANRVPEYETLGWQPTCDCKNASRVPSLILDPFLGSGTTAWVAKKMGRRCVGYEISREYCDLAVERCRQQVLF